MKSYRGPDGSERIWYEDSEIEQMMESELRTASLLPTMDAPVVDIERFIERHLRAALDQYAELDAATLGVTEFFVGDSPKISINQELTGSALDDGESAPGILGRWRATLAHEASHVLLHRFIYELAAKNLSLFGPGDEGQFASKRLHRCLKRDASYRPVSDWREVQANKGMAALLMPQRLFLEAARSEIRAAYPLKNQIPPGGESGVAVKLATRFKVSRQAARIRLETLGVLSPAGQEQL